MNDIGRMAVAGVLAAVIALGGCGGSDQPDGAAVAAPQERHLLEAVEQPLDRAREVEDISGARKGELDREIEAAE
jgi:hypothetical protein